jgi:hypothetical protein
MNLKGSECKQPWLNRDTIPEGLRKTIRLSSGTVDVPVEIRAGHLPNTNPEHQAAGRDSAAGTSSLKHAELVRE